MKKVAIIGRPNVGKSTLFNRLSHGRRAIVSAVAGTTRDIRKYAVAETGGPGFVLMDTAGLEAGGRAALSSRMTALALSAAKEADIILFVVDARASVLPEDIRFAETVRKYGKRVILVANKAENRADFHAALGDMAALGFGEPIPVSAEHGQGSGALLDAVRREIDAMMKQDSSEAALSDGELGEIIEIEEESADDPHELSVRIAIVGRPNAGKSTLANVLLGEERMLTGSEAGLTRDAIDTDFKYRGRAVKLVDTAGLRKKNKVVEELEQMSTARAIEAVKNSDVAIVVVDAETGLDRQDLAIAEVAVNEGKGVAVAINKSDILKDKKAALAAARNRLETSFRQVKDIPILMISAAKKAGIDRLMAAAFELYDVGRQRVGTGRLNRWLEHATSKNPPPLSRLKRPMNVKYITQSAVKPPTFTLFVGGASVLPDNYARYLVNSLSEEFGFSKVPVRLKVKTSENPYSGGGK
jgi:GTP-binding protein